MTYEPTLLDAASDLRRCVYSSIEPAGLEDPEFLIFWKNAKAIIKENDSQIPGEVRSHVYKCIANVEDKTLSKTKRQEDILMAAILLQSEATI